MIHFRDVVLVLVMVYVAVTIAQERGKIPAANVLDYYLLFALIGLFLFGFVSAVIAADVAGKDGRDGD